LVVVAQFEDVAPSPDGDRGTAALIREEVVAGLSRFGDLRVITESRSLDSFDVGEQAHLAGAYALGASLRAAPDGARLTVRLVRIGDRSTIWSGLFLAPGTGVVETIDSIIAKTVGGVLPKINADLLNRPSHLPIDPTYRRFLVAKAEALSARDHVAATAAAQNLEKIIADHPKFTLPHLTLAYLYNTDFNYTLAGSSKEEQYSRALYLTKRTLSLDRGYAPAYTVAGWCYLRRRSWDSARRHFEQALELNPFCANRSMEAGFGRLFLGDLAESETLLDRCLLLNPSPDDNFFQDLGFLALIRGDHDRAASYFELIADPGVWAKLYDAANAELGAFASAEKSEAARLAVSTIWPADRPSAVEDIVNWVALHHPFRVPAMEERFLKSIRLALTRAAA
jgi:Tfp pilus assembly protein PilF/TolB-like protein